MKRCVAASLLLLACWVMLGVPASARALVMRLPSLPEKVVQSEVIIVGKVQALEDKPVEAKPFPGSPQKSAFTVATIRIEESLTGAKGLTHIRVGFIPQSGIDAPTTGGRPIRPRGGFAPTLKVDQEGCFFLQKHPDGDFYIMAQWCSPLDRKEDSFPKQVELVRKSVNILETPVNSLKSKNAEERLLAASLLLQKYRQARNPAGGAMKQVPIDGEESRLIMLTIAEAEWVKNDPETMTQSGQMLFNLLGAQPKDGWTPPRVKPGQDYQAMHQKAAKEWLKAHADKFRIQKWVVDQKK